MNEPLDMSKLGKGRKGPWDKAVKDKCVSCECDTVYDQHHHIDFRIGYVEGAGQLCLECYDKIYVHERQSVTIEDSTLRIATDQTVKDV